MALRIGKLRLMTRGGRRVRTWCALFFLLVGATAYGIGDASATKEFQIKAVFLYNFAQFVEWPSNAFDSPESPLIIGVLGQDPFGDYLDQTVAGERVGGRPLQIQRYRRAEDVRQCHILFISASESGHADEVMEHLRGKSILTVCDAESRQPAAMVRFFMDRNRVRLRIDPETAKLAGLTISSKLLRSAEIVPRP